MTRYLIRILCIILLLAQLQAAQALATGRGVVLNFNEVDIATMVKFISDLTGRNFVLDERVKGKISVYSPSKLSIEEAYNVFVSVLELKGFTVVQSGRVAKIVPTASAKQYGLTLLPPGTRAPVNESYVAMVIKLENIGAQDALTFLQPMVSKDGYLSVYGPGNMMLMVDSALNIRKLQNILAAIDTERTREGVEIIYLKNASAESAVTVIRQWLNGGDSKASGQAGAQSSSSSGLGNLMADQRLNAILVFGNDKIKRAVRDMAARLDVAPPEASSKVNVYYLENTDATELAKVLEGVVKGAAAAQATGQTAAAASQASPFDSGKVTITPDKASNSLVIMASTADYANLAQVIKKLDRRSKQVFVQVLIAEVSLDKSRELGMETGVLGGAALNKYLTVAGLYDPLGSLSSVGTAVTSLTSAISNPNITASPANVTAVLKALEKKDLLNILSTPNILTSDNKEAEINVGENVPFKGSTTQNSVTTTTSIDRKDVGIKLKITPQISEGDYIRLKIEQEISAVKNDKGDAVDLVTTTRSAKTNVVIRDKETIVIGGLIQDSDEEVINKFPLLGDIPGLGWLFKTKTKTRKKTNLMILLTPSIVRDAADLSAVSKDQRNIFGEAARNAEPVDVRSCDRGEGSDAARNQRGDEDQMNNAASEQLRALAARLGIGCKADISVNDVDGGLLARVPLAFARAHLLLPLEERESAVCVAIGDPAALLVLDELRLAFGKPVEAVLVPSSGLTDAINHAYASISGSSREVLQELEGEDLSTIATELSDPQDLLDLSDEAPVIRLLNSILSEAVKERASDIHIEPYERELIIRFRIDGILYERLSPPRIIQEALASRVKIMAGLNIAEKRLPQDGRIRVIVAGRDVDIRVSIIPTFYGERTVLRLLDKKKGVLSLGDIGLGEAGVRTMERMLVRSNGIILVTGPTGSGKSTTLYAALNRVNSSAKNIITIEDPIEYQIRGIGQIQVNPKIELTFAGGLRSILRQDPDIIMVGEIRDAETAEIAIQASLTGHLVLSTLHTNDAASAITRLVDMGIEPFMIASSLTAVMAQRLVRLVCPHCREAYTPQEHYAGVSLPERLYRGRGCERCFGLGTLGRTAIYEIMPVDQEICSMIIRRAHAGEIKEYSVSRGMKTLRDDGLQRAAEGVTTIEEVLRVTQDDYADVPL